MDTSVNLKVLLNAEHFMAELAFERPLARMCSVVAHLIREKKKFSRVREIHHSAWCLEANGTNVRFSVLKLHERLS